MTDQSTRDAKIIDLERALERTPAAGERNWRREPPASDLFGVALSGGGIRSATFNLGLLQGLHRLRLLGMFDYLSTVSGGGYIGAFWTRWRSRTLPERAGAHRGLFPEVAGMGPSEPPEVRHLREFSNFLRPRLGILSFDTGRIVVALLSAIVPSVLIALSLLVLAVFAWELLASAVIESFLVRTTVGGWPLPAGDLFIIGATSLSLGVFEVLWRRRREASDWTRYAAVSVLAIGLSLLAWWGLAGPRSVTTFYSPVGPVRGVPTDARHWAVVFEPSIAWGLVILALTVVRTLPSRLPRLTSFRGALDRVTSRLAFLAVAWAVAAGFWYVATVIFVQALGGAVIGPAASLTAVFAYVFSRVQQYFGREPNKPAGSKLIARLKPRLPQVLAYAVLALTIVVTMWLMLATQAATLDLRGVPAPISVVVALGISVIALIAFNPNAVGLHAFYRARIARAYLGASGLAAEARRTDEQSEDDMALRDANAARPLHLVCCAANDLAPREPLANLSRGADSAVLSPVGMLVGDDFVAWKTSEKDPRPIPSPTLAGAVTASGAAFNSHMGGKSVKLGLVVTSLMTALDLRLGLWWPHPVKLREDYRRPAPAPPAGSTATVAAAVSFPRRVAHALDRSARRVLSGLPFYKELLGISRAEDGQVLLSDGGHFENMAIYELVRRHCRYILASDCGQDPDVAFDDFGNLVRRVREDFGVEIVIDLAPLRPDARGCARQPMVAGDIRYPTGDTGVLLLVKPTLTGNEPPDIAQYKTRNQIFPHESTLDQFYDEAQWESYRRLGEHCIADAFQRLEAQRPPDQDALTFGPRLFALARREWLATPADQHERFRRIAEGITQLDALLLEDAKFAELRNQVLAEVRTVNRQLGGGGGVATPDLSVAALLEALKPIRRALVFMEQTYLAEDLEARYNHPMYLGVMNYFAHWLAAPLVHAWWPILKPMFVPRFAWFVEERFGLRAAAAHDARLGIGSVAGDLAATRWLHQGGRLPLAEEIVITYRIPIGPQPKNGVGETLNAAQLIARREQDVLFWHANEFFVPSGFWGVGIGEGLLRLLTRSARTLETPSSANPVTSLLVRIAPPIVLDAGARKTAADEAQMYRAAQFTPLTIASGASTVTMNGVSVDLSAFLPSGAQRAGEQWLYYALADLAANGAGESESAPDSSGHGLPVPDGVLPPVTPPTQTTN
jgi:hypothetical protein